MAEGQRMSESRRIALTGVHAATARRPPTLRFRIPIWNAATLLADGSDVRLTIGPAETLLGDIAEVGTLVSADISACRQV